MEPTDRPARRGSPVRQTLSVGLVASCLVHALVVGALLMPRGDDRGGGETFEIADVEFAPEVPEATAEERAAMAEAEPTPGPEPEPEP